jgi:hypothetical protein
VGGAAPDECDDGQGSGYGYDGCYRNQVESVPANVPSQSPHLFEIGLANAMKDRGICLLAETGRKCDHVHSTESGREQ